MFRYSFEVNFFSKYQRTKGNILNDIFGDFKFVVCFAPLWHEVDRNIIFDLGSTDESVKSKRRSGDTPTRRAWLCALPHGSVVGATSSHVLGSLVPVVTVQKIYGREVVSFYRVASLTAYNYLRRVIVLFLVSDCIKVYNIRNIYNIHRVYSIYKVQNIPSLLSFVSCCRKIIISSYCWIETFSLEYSTISIWFGSHETPAVMR